MATGDVIFGDLSPNNRLACFSRTEYKAQVLRDLQGLVKWGSIKTLDLPSLGYALCSSISKWRHKRVLVIDIVTGSTIGEM